MTAQLYTRLGHYKYQVFCHECQDGINTRSLAIAQEWADRHNQKEHAA